MKKSLLIVLAALFAACTLFGCGGKGPTRNVIEGVDYTFEGHEIGDAVYVKVVDAGLGGDWIKALADAYYEETGIPVETSSDPSLVTSVENAMVLSGNEKDDIYFVAQGNSNWLDWTNRNKIAPLDDVLESEKYGTAASTRAQDKTVLDIGKYGDTTYMLPYVYSNWGLVYNQAYLDRIESYGEYVKGEWPQTMQGLIDLCAATKSASITNPRTGRTVSPFSCGLNVNYMNYMFYTLWDELDSEGLYSYLNQNDTSGYDASEFNSQEVLTTFELLFDLIGAKSPTDSNMCAAAEDHLAAQTNFVNGNCVFTFSGVWFENEMQKILNSVGLKTYHYGAYPVINSANQHRLFMNLPGEFFFIPSDAVNVWGAKDFLAFCMSEKGIAAAERKLNMPLAFTTDEEVEFSDFGKEIETVVANSKKFYYFSQNSVYKTGALRFFLQTKSPFLKMSQYDVTDKNQIQSQCISAEIAVHNQQWTDFMKHIE